MTDQVTDQVTVTASALRSLICAVIGEPHYIRELQATRNPVLFPDNPINVLIDEYNEFANKRDDDEAAAQKNN